MNVRRCQYGDEPALYEVYYSAIHMIATEAQVNAWAPGSIDPNRWSDRMRGITPFVMEIEKQILGYADVQSSGYIDHFFVSGRHPRQGIGALLMHRIHQEALDSGIEELTSHVSRTAEPFFARNAFVVAERREPLLRGVTVPNALMSKSLCRSAT